MPANSAELSPDDIIAAFSKPGVTAAPMFTAANDAARSANAWVADKTAPLRPPGDTALGPNATAADIPPDSPAGQVRMGVTLSAPQQDIDPQATFEALSARRNKLLAAGVDPKSDPEYVALLRQQATAIAQNNQAGAMFLLPGGALEGGAAGIVARGVNRLTGGAAPEAAVNRLVTPEVAPAAPSGPPAPVQPAFNALLEPPPAAAGAPPAAPRYNVSPPASNRLASPPADYPRYDERGNRLAASAPPETPAATPPPAEAPTENKFLAPPATEPAPVETPQSGPKGNILPIKTEAQADARADEIIRHFAQGGNTTIDQTEIIPGSTPTLAKSIVGGNPGISALERRVMEDNPNAFQPNVDKVAKARSDHFAAIAGTKEADDVAAGHVSAAYRAEDERVFSPENIRGPADPSPVIKIIDDALAGRQGQRGAIADALHAVRDKLVDADGKLQTNPDLLYGVRQDINDSIGPLAQGTKNDRRAAARELIGVREALTPVIDEVAPGFSDFIDRFSKDMGPIEGRRYLRSMRLTDANANITLGKLDNAIKTLESQRNLPGLRAGDSVTEEQLAALNTLRDDFRTDSKRQLGRSLGSNTMQNAGTSRALDVLTHPAVTAATTIAGASAEPIFGLGGPALKYWLSSMDAKGQQMVMDALKRKLVNPADAASAFAKR